MARILLMSLVGLAIFSAPAGAVIERPLPLSRMILDSDLIFVVKVEKIQPTAPGVVLTFQQDLKGKAAARRLTVNLKGDELNHSPILLKRIAPDLPIVVFVSVDGKIHRGLAFINGTWFQIIGADDDTPWKFTHCEPYLRRSFKGTTEELQKLITAAVADPKTKLPKLDSKETPGFGPEIPAQADLPKKADPPKTDPPKKSD